LCTTIYWATYAFISNKRLRSDPGETQKKVIEVQLKKKNIFRYNRTLNVFLNNEFRKTPTAEARILRVIAYSPVIVTL